MLVTNILEQIKRDIASFADPGTEVELSDRSLSWTRSRVRMLAQLIRKPDGFPDISFGGREYTYTSFLASEALADLKDLAATIFATSAPPPNFVPVYARLTDDDAAPKEAGPLVLSQTADRKALPVAATRVLFVHGNAGTGKTSTLRHAARHQAERYLRGETKTLLLYLDAQGKGLSQLEDVMARALQDLRAKFTYHSVAALTRRHCVVPVVDGFDELIGPSSAREAFSNLSQFLAQLDCEGALIASSRSAFIDYRTLHERAAELAASQNLSYEIVPVEVLDWDEMSIDAYCDGRTTNSEGLRARVHELMRSGSGALVRKPFFLAKVCDIILEGGAIDVGRDIPRQVVDAALAREASKLKDPRGKQLLTMEQHRAFCEALADEMWSLGSPELDCDSVRLLAELVAEDHKLDAVAAKVLRDRSIAHGLLTAVPNRIPEKRAFEHELFRFEFQAGSLAKILTSDSPTTRDYIQRAELPLDVVARLPSYGVREAAVVNGILAKLTTIVASAPNTQYASTNAGSIAAAIVRGREDLPRGMRMMGFYFRSQDFGNCCFEEADLSGSILENVNLAQAKLIKCNLDGSQFTGCAFSPAGSWQQTDVGNTLIYSIRWQGREIYDPREISLKLRELGAIVPGEPTAPTTLAPEVSERVQVVERLLTHARSHFYISRNERWFQNNLAKSPAWGFVEQLLRDHNLLEDVALQKSGGFEKFLRLTAAPDRILRARAEKAPPNPASAFWRELVR